MKKRLIILVLIAKMSVLSGIVEAALAEKDKEASPLKKTEEITAEVLKVPLKLVEGVLGFALEPIVVTPWGSEEYIFNVSKNVSVITKEDIENSNAKTLPELMGYKTGIVVSEFLGNPKGVNVDIRGFGEASNTNLLVLIDGRRANQIDLSGVDWAQIDLNAVERIEIVRGASTVLYGDNATGGVINIITKKGYTEKPTAKLGGGLGSHNYHTEYGTFQGYHNIIDYFFSYNHKDEDGFRENNKYKSNDWFGRITFHPIEYFDFGTSVGYHRDKYGMPGALYQRDLDLVGRRGTVNPDDKAKTEDIYLTGEPKVYMKLPNHKLTASVHGTYRRRESEGLNIFTSPVFHGQTNHKINSGDIRPKLEVSSILWENRIDNNLVLGTDHFIAVDNIISGNLLTGRDDVDITKRTTALYIYDNIELFDRFLLNGGYRYEWLDYKFEQRGQATNNDRKGLNEWAFELGGGYKYNPFSQVYIDYSRSYRYPVSEEYYQSVTVFFGSTFGGLNPEIKQQVGHNLEVGIKDNSLKWLQLNADCFWIDTKREIYFDPTNFTNTNYAPRTKRRGFDIEARANLMDKRLVPYVNYTYQRARFDGGVYDNNDIPLVPINKFSAGITAIPITNLTWNVVLNYSGSRFFISDQRNQVQKLNSYATVDTRLSYKWKALTFHAGINNIFNRKYTDYGVTNSTGSAITYYPSQERRFEIGGTMEF